MLIGTCVKVGNSLMIPIPRDLQRELGISRGAHVVLRTDHEGRVTIEELTHYVDGTRAHRASTARTD